MINKLKLISIEFYILFAVVFFRREYLNKLSIIFIGFVAICTLFEIRGTYGRRMSKGIFWGFFLLIAILLFIIVKSRYSISETLTVFIFLCLAYLEFRHGKRIQIEDKYQEWFDVVLTCGLFLYWLMAAINNISDYTLFVLPSAWDKNYTGITIFLIFVYFWKRKKVFGLLSCALYAVTLNSRLFLLNIFLFIFLSFVINGITKYFERLMNKALNFTSKEILILIMILTFLTVGLSFFWTYYISNNKVVGYRQSLNDSSNAIRTRSNLYAVALLKNNSELFFYGYDDDIKIVLGVENEDTATKYNGYRLVQPHNLVLNLFLKHGIAFSLVYLYLISKILNCYWKKENLAFIITYLFANMFMHSLLSTTYLLLFFFVLCVEPQWRRT